MHHDFVRRWDCGGNWDKHQGLAWTIIASDLTFFVTFTVIAAVICFWLSRRHHRSLRFIFWGLGVFTFLCGLTHLADAMAWWYPNYFLIGMVKLGGAAVSVVTAVRLVPSVPAIMRVPSVQVLGGKLEETRGELISLQLRLAKMDESTKKMAAAKLNSITDQLKGIE